MSWNSGLASIGRAVVVVFFAGLTATSAQAVPDVTWTASTSGEGVADEVAPGYTTFTVTNDVETPYSMLVFKLKNGTDLTAFEAANDALNVAFSGQGDPSPLMNKVLTLADVATEINPAPGQSESVGLILEPGNYVLDGGADLEQGGPATKRTYHSFTVAGQPQATAPTADVTVQLSEFAFTLPDTIEAGEQTWKVSNVGKEVHHMVLFKLNEGTTMDDFMNALSGEQGPPPAEDAGYVGTSSSGQSSFHMLDFTPGSYVAICFIPDHAASGDGAPHFTHGMIKNFEVASN